MRQITVLVATTAAAICVWLGLSHFDTTGTTASIFAQTVEQIRDAQNITWTTMIYERITSKDGRRHWYITNLRKMAYKTPGLYRETAFDEEGNVAWVEITDAVNNKVLTLHMADKTAMLAEVRPCEDPEGPFFRVRQSLTDPDLEFVERRKTAAGEVNVFRRVEGTCFFDYWIDQKSKQLVEYHIHQGGNSLMEYENDPVRNAKPERDISHGTIVGSITREIVYNADLDDSLFQLDVPKGYMVTTHKHHFVAEHEMIDFIRVLVEANDKVFPDQITDIPADRYNQCRKLPKAERPPEAQRLIETADYYEHLHLHGLPLREFLMEDGECMSFRYLGKGAKLGQKDRIVCWYKLKNAQDSSTYRVVYGDLSVKDVAAKDLPLPVGR
jgi:hypothetical protein